MFLEFAGGKRCRVEVLAGGGLDALERLWLPEWRAAAVIGDEQVLSIYGAELSRRLERLASHVVVAPFPPGEAHKTRATKEALEDRLLEAGLGRQACVVAIGGGISLDVAGFVAATYLRGVPHVNLPTSLLAQVDAAIGGKTGVNTPHGKNLVGAFHQPVAVVMDSNYLRTLPRREWLNGMAELVKHAVIDDRELFEWLEARVERLCEPEVLDPYPLRRCVEIKGAIVQQDEREDGLRAVLNFGHTVGHALEAASGYAVDHGRAVGVGMVVEMQIAAELCGTPTADVERLRAMLRRLGVIGPDLPHPPFAELQPFLAKDKKRVDGKIRMALPARLGGMLVHDGMYTCAVPLDVVQRAWERAT